MLTATGHRNLKSVRIVPLWDATRVKARPPNTYPGGTEVVEIGVYISVVGWVTAPVGTTIVVEPPDGLVKTNVGS
jgi:hypothetical protein